MKRPVLRQFGGGITSQMLQSAANFGLSVIVARTCSKSEYGLYTIAFTTLILITTFQNALFIAPFQVIAPGKKENDRIFFASGIALNQAVLFLGLSALATAGYLGYGIVKHNMTQFVFIMVFILAACAWVGREFVRALNSSYLNIKALLSGEIAYAGIAVIGTILFWYFKILNSQYALVCLAGACIIGSLIGLTQSKQRFVFGIVHAKAALKETSRFSGWAIVGVIIYMVQSQSYVYLLSAMTSLVETAEINAVKMFLMPIGLLMGGIGRIFIPKGSEIVNRGGGNNRLMKLVAGMILALLLLSIVYCIVLGIFFKEVVILTIGNKYAGTGQYFLLWAVFFLAQVIRYPMSSALQVLKKFKYTALVGAISTAVTISVCYFGIKTLGAKGVIAGLLCGEIIGILFSIPALKHKTAEAL
jgi:O-antigen/teichoic acid export membrane protein